MLSTSQNIREQVQSLSETIVSHLSTISQESKAAIQKSEQGDTTVDADQVVSSFVDNLTNDLLKHKKVNVEEIDVEFGSSITAGRHPQEHEDRIKQIKLSEEDQIMANVKEQYQEAKQVIAELFDIYQQTMQNFTKVMNEQKNLLKMNQDNSLTKKLEQSEDFMIKSQSKLLSQDSDFQQTILVSFDDSLQELIKKQTENVRKNVDLRTKQMQKFLQELQEISRLTVNQFLDIKQPQLSQNNFQIKQSAEKIVTHWTETVFQTGVSIQQTYHRPGQMDELGNIYGQNLHKIALDKIWYCHGVKVGLSYEYLWNFGFNQNQTSNFKTRDQTLSSFNLDQEKNPIKKIIFFNNIDDWLSGLKFCDKNGKLILSVGNCKTIKKEIVLEDGQVIIGVAASQGNTGGVLTDFKFLLGKVEQY